MGNPVNKYSRPESPDSLAKRYEDQAQIQRAAIRELTGLRVRLSRLECAFRTLFADEHFTTLLRAEGLDAAPAILVSRTRSVRKRGAESPERETASVEDMLHARKLSPTGRYELARMLPSRQEEAARLMIASACFTSPYIRAIVGACEKSQLIKPKARPRTVILAKPIRATVNREISDMANQLRELESLNGVDLMVLFVGVRYAERLLMNRRIKAYLHKRRSDLEGIVGTHSGRSGSATGERVKIRPMVEARI
jgi:hypothetical protein